jgi:hypothetical protein
MEVTDLRVLMNGFHDLWRELEVLILVSLPVSRGVKSLLYEPLKQGLIPLMLILLPLG